MDYLEEHERRNEALFDRIDRRLGAIEDRLLATPPPQDSRQDPGVEVAQRPRRAGRKTDGILRVGLVTYHVPLQWPHSVFSFSIFPAMYSQAHLRNVWHQIPREEV